MDLWFSTLLCLVTVATFSIRCLLKKWSQINLKINFRVQERLKMYFTSITSSKSAYFQMSRVSRVSFAPSKNSQKGQEIKFRKLYSQIYKWDRIFKKEWLSSWYLGSILWVPRSAKSTYSLGSLSTWQRVLLFKTCLIKILPSMGFMLLFWLDSQLK